MPNDELALLEKIRQSLSSNFSRESLDWNRIRAWHSESRTYISQYWPSHLEQFDSHIVFDWIKIKLTQNPTSHEARESERKVANENDVLCGNAKSRLYALLSGLIEINKLEASKAHVLLTEQKRLENIKTQALSVTPSANANQIQSNKIFIVHGHDIALKEQVARTLTTLGLNPVILHEKPNAGKTIIEKFEEHADVSFAVILLTPDDMSYVTASNSKNAKPRARQNVVFELGYFIGKLGRERVFTLKKGDDLEILSDFSGVVYTSYDASGHWRYDLVKELQEAKYTVDANKLLKS